MSKRTFNQDDSLISVCAFRYALGRRTYITAVVSSYLIQNWDLLTQRDRELISHEIDDAFYPHKNIDLGDNCDKLSWKKVALYATLYDAYAANQKVKGSKKLFETIKDEITGYRDIATPYQEAKCLIIDKFKRLKDGQRD